MEVRAFYRPSFKIPRKQRRPSEDCQYTLPVDSREAKEIEHAVKRQTWDMNDLDRAVSILQIKKVDNPNLEREYHEKKAELRDEGRSPKELTEQMAFCVETEDSRVKEICRIGLECNGIHHTLGDGCMGVTVWKCPDLCLRALSWPTSGSAYLLVFKIVKGRVKSVTPRLSPESPNLEPTPNHDCHISRNTTSSSVAELSTLLRNTQYYLYEYDDEGLPSMRPRHCLPFAVIPLKRNECASPRSPKRPLLSAEKPVSPGKEYTKHTEELKTASFSDEAGILAWRGLVTSGDKSLGRVSLMAGHKLGLNFWKSYLDVSRKIPLKQLARMLPGDVRTAWKFPLLYRNHSLSLCTMKVTQGQPSETFTSFTRRLVIKAKSAGVLCIDSATTMFLVPSCKLAMHLGFCESEEPPRMFCIVCRRQSTPLSPNSIWPLTNPVTPPASSRTAFQPNTGIPVDNEASVIQSSSLDMKAKYTAKIVVSPTEQLPRLSPKHTHPRQVVKRSLSFSHRPVKDVTKGLQRTSRSASSSERLGFREDSSPKPAILSEVSCDSSMRRDSFVADSSHAIEDDSCDSVPMADGAKSKDGRTRNDSEKEGIESSTDTKGKVKASVNTLASLTPELGTVYLAHLATLKKCSNVLKKTKVSHLESDVKPSKPRKPLMEQTDFNASSNVTPSKDPPFSDSSSMRDLKENDTTIEESPGMPSIVEDAFSESPCRRDGPYSSKSDREHEASLCSTTSAPSALKCSQMTLRESQPSTGERSFQQSSRTDTSRAREISTSSSPNRKENEVPLSSTSPALPSLEYSCVTMKETPTTPSATEDSSPGFSIASPLPFWPDSPVMLFSHDTPENSPAKEVERFQSTKVIHGESTVPASNQSQSCDELAAKTPENLATVHKTVSSSEVSRETAFDASGTKTSSNAILPFEESTSYSLYLRQDGLNSAACLEDVPRFYENQELHENLQNLQMEILESSNNDAINSLKNTASPTEIPQLHTYWDNDDYLQTIDMEISESLPRPVVLSQAYPCAHSVPCYDYSRSNSNSVVSTPCCVTPYTGDVTMWGPLKEHKRNENNLASSSHMESVQQSSVTMSSEPLPSAFDYPQSTRSTTCDNSTTKANNRTEFIARISPVCAVEVVACETRSLEVDSTPTRVGVDTKGFESHDIVKAVDLDIADNSEMLFHSVVSERDPGRCTLVRHTELLDSALTNPPQDLKHSLSQADSPCEQNVAGTSGRTVVEATVSKMDSGYSDVKSPCRKRPYSCTSSSYQQDIVNSATTALQQDLNHSVSSTSTADTQAQTTCPVEEHKSSPTRDAHTYGKVLGFSLSPRTSPKVCKRRLKTLQDAFKTATNLNGVDADVSSERFPTTKPVRDMSSPRKLAVSPFTIRDQDHDTRTSPKVCKRRLKSLQEAFKTATNLNGFDDDVCSERFPTTKPVRDMSSPCKLAVSPFTIRDQDHDTRTSPKVCKHRLKSLQEAFKTATNLNGFDDDVCSERFPTTTPVRDMSSPSKLAVRPFTILDQDQHTGTLESNDCKRMKKSHGARMKDENKCPKLSTVSSTACEKHVAVITEQTGPCLGGVIEMSLVEDWGLTTSPIGCNKTQLREKTCCLLHMEQDDDFHTTETDEALESIAVEPLTNECNIPEPEVVVCSPVAPQETFMFRFPGKSEFDEDMTGIGGSKATEEETCLVEVQLGGLTPELLSNLDRVSETIVSPSEELVLKACSPESLVDDFKNVEVEDMVYVSPLSHETAENGYSIALSDVFPSAREDDKMFEDSGCVNRFVERVDPQCFEATKEKPAILSENAEASQTLEAKRGAYVSVNLKGDKWYTEMSLPSGSVTTFENVSQLPAVDPRDDGNSNIEMREGLSKREGKERHSGNAKEKGGCSMDVQGKDRGTGDATKERVFSTRLLEENHPRNVTEKEKMLNCPVELPCLTENKRRVHHEQATTEGSHLSCSSQCSTEVERKVTHPEDAKERVEMEKYPGELLSRTEEKDREIRSEKVKENSMETTDCLGKSPSEEKGKEICSEKATELMRMEPTECSGKSPTEEKEGTKRREKIFLEKATEKMMKTTDCSGKTPSKEKEKTICTENDTEKPMKTADCSGKTPSEEKEKTIYTENDTEKGMKTTDCSGKNPSEEKESKNFPGNATEKRMKTTDCSDRAPSEDTGKMICTEKATEKRMKTTDCTGKAPSEEKENNICTEKATEQRMKATDCSGKAPSEDNGEKICTETVTEKRMKTTDCSGKAPSEGKDKNICTENATEKRMKTTDCLGKASSEENEKKICTENATEKGMETINCPIIFSFLTDAEGKGKRTNRLSSLPEAGDESRQQLAFPGCAESKNKPENDRCDNLAVKQFAGSRNDCLLNESKGVKPANTTLRSLLPSTVRNNNTNAELKRTNLIATARSAAAPKELRAETAKHSKPAEKAIKEVQASMSTPKSPVSSTVQNNNTSAELKSKNSTTTAQLDVAPTELRAETAKHSKPAERTIKEVQAVMSTPKSSVSSTVQNNTTDAELQSKNSTTTAQLAVAPTELRAETAKHSSKPAEKTIKEVQVVISTPKSSVSSTVQNNNPSAELKSKNSTTTAQLAVAPKELRAETAKHSKPAEKTVKEVQAVMSTPKLSVSSTVQNINTSAELKSKNTTTAQLAVAPKELRAETAKHSKPAEKTIKELQAAMSTPKLSVCSTVRNNNTNAALQSKNSTTTAQLAVAPTELRAETAKHSKPAEKTIKEVQAAMSTPNSSVSSTVQNNNTSAELESKNSTTTAQLAVAPKELRAETAKHSKPAEKTIKEVQAAMSTPNSSVSSTVRNNNTSAELKSKNSTTTAQLAVVPKELRAETVKHSKPAEKTIKEVQVALSTPNSSVSSTVQNNNTSAELKSKNSTTTAQLDVAPKELRAETAKHSKPAEKTIKEVQAEMSTPKSSVSSTVQNNNTSAELKSKNSTTTAQLDVAPKELRAETAKHSKPAEKTIKDVQAAMSTPKSSVSSTVQNNNTSAELKSKNSTTTAQLAVAPTELRAETAKRSKPAERTIKDVQAAMSTPKSSVSSTVQNNNTSAELQSKNSTTTAQLAVEPTELRAETAKHSKPAEKTIKEVQAAMSTPKSSVSSTVQNNNTSAELKSKNSTTTAQLDVAPKELRAETAKHSKPAEKAIKEVQAAMSTPKSSVSSTVQNNNTSAELKSKNSTTTAQLDVAPKELRAETAKHSKPAEKTIKDVQAAMSTPKSSVSSTVQNNNTSADHELKSKNSTTTAQLAVAPTELRAETAKRSKPAERTIKEVQAVMSTPKSSVPSTVQNNNTNAELQSKNSTTTAQLAVEPTELRAETTKHSKPAEKTIKEVQAIISTPKSPVSSTVQNNNTSAELKSKNSTTTAQLDVAPKELRAETTKHSKPAEKTIKEVQAVISTPKSSVSSTVQNNNSSAELKSKNSTTTAQLAVAPKQLRAETAKHSKPAEKTLKEVQAVMSTPKSSVSSTVRNNNTSAELKSKNSTTTAQLAVAPTELRAETAKHSKPAENTIKEVQSVMSTPKSSVSSTVRNNNTSAALKCKNSTTTAQLAVAPKELHAEETAKHCTPAEKTIKAIDDFSLKESNEVKPAMSSSSSVSSTVQNNNTNAELKRKNATSTAQLPVKSRWLSAKTGMNSKPAQQTVKAVEPVKGAKLDSASFLGTVQSSVRYTEAVNNTKLANNSAKTARSLCTSSRPACSYTKREVHNKQGTITTCGTRVLYKDTRGKSEPLRDMKDLQRNHMLQNMERKRAAESEWWGTQPKLIRIPNQMIESEGKLQKLSSPPPMVNCDRGLKRDHEMRMSNIRDHRLYQLYPERGQFEYLSPQVDYNRESKRFKAIHEHQYYPYWASPLRAPFPVNNRGTEILHRVVPEEPRWYPQRGISPHDPRTNQDRFEEVYPRFPDCGRPVFVPRSCRGHPVLSPPPDLVPGPWLPPGNSFYVPYPLVRPR